MQQEQNHPAEHSSTSFAENTVDNGEKIIGWENRPRRRRRRRGMIVLGIFLICIGVGYTLLQGNQENNRRYIDQQQNFLGDISDIDLRGKNGSIVVRGYTGEQIEVQITAIPRVDNPLNSTIQPVEVVMENEKMYLQYRDSDYRSVSVEMQVPEKKVGSIRLTTSNSTIVLEKVKSEKIRLDTSNGSIHISEIDAEIIEAKGSNGKIYADAIQAETVNLITSNASIQGVQIDSERLEMKTSNASIEYSIHEDLEKYSDYRVRLESSNGSIRFLVPKGDRIGYKLEARTSNGNIKSSLDHLVATTISNTLLNGMTEGYDSMDKRVEADIKTSNGNIYIN